MGWTRSRSGVRRRVLRPGMELRVWEEGRGWVVEVLGERLQGLAYSRETAKQAAETAARHRLMEMMRELSGTW